MVLIIDEKLVKKKVTKTNKNKKTRILARAFTILWFVYENKDYV